ncbi:lipopolysaccharide biosynthesis protein RfbH [candidate division TA06 bacterium]|uniref:Lipopolysaccharide biosynthesis protein RfbH n=1 Tax=candidate division TA06 bacterium TaxID=2250710 RepID=A0A933IBP5_UNCT6|nr:lipopolysaccharide biosynthesis protein RfbH [candidate division TA06 bacterium]
MPAKTNTAAAVRKRILHEVAAYYRLAHKKHGLFVPGERIAYAGRMYDHHEMTALVDSALEFWLTTGRFAGDFENKFAAFLNSKHCSLVNSGSSANLLAFAALASPLLGKKRIRPGDEVITVAAAFPTTVAPILQFGATPVFVDVSLPSYNIDCDLLETALTRKTRAVFLAHTLGNPFNIKIIKRFCETHNLWLIEDNCDALGSKYCLNGAWRYTGTFGDLGTSSFYPPHHMTMGEGGAVYTDNLLLKRIVESLRDWGRDCWCPSGKDDTCGKRFSRAYGELPLGYDHKYVYSHFGYNLKATEMQAAVGCAQLKKLPRFVESRKRNWDILRQGLSDLAEYFILPEPTPGSDPSWFGFLLTVRTGAGFTREQIVRHLESHNIQTRMLFAGNILRQPCFDEFRKAGKGYRVVSAICGGKSSGKIKNVLPVTDQIMRDTFWIGVYPGMTRGMLAHMIDTIREFVNQ